MFCPKLKVNFSLCLLVQSLISSILFFTLAQSSVAHAQSELPFVQMPPGFIQETVATGFSVPTGFAIAPDGRIFVAQKDGVMRVFHDGELQPEPFIDLRHEVNANADRGMMSVAVHPGFPATPYVYLSYVYEPVEASGYFDDGARVSRVLRISADPANPNVHLPGSGVVIVGANSRFANIGNPNEANQPPFSCQHSDGSSDGGFVQDCLPAEGTAHVIGMVRFGPDGALYVANGDGSQNTSINGRAVDPNSLAGKILRVNPITGLGYANNPFYDGDPTSNRSKVFAMGMRNPFRFTFSPFTGELFVADVGNDVWEEINRGGSGSNFGWPCFEGPDRAAGHAICQPLFDGAAPVTAAAHIYDHSEGKGAAIGGAFYTGSSYPGQYRGAYFYSDFNKGLLQYLTFSGGTQERAFGTGAEGVVQMEMLDGMLHILYIRQGTLARVRYAGQNVPPVALFGATPISGRVPLTVSFDASRSYDPNDDSFLYAWDFGDGTTTSITETTGIRTSHVYSQEGQFRATLTLNDSRGAVSTAAVTVYVGNVPPTAEILLPKVDATYRIGDEIPFLGWAEDDEDGLLSGENLEWTATLHHRDHEHYDFHNSEGASGTLTYADHGDNAYLELCLTATDLEGLRDKMCRELKAEEAVYTFKSIPSGLPVLYAGSPYTTPFKVLTYVNAERSISTPNEPKEGTEFLIWSDGGRRRHDLTIQPDVTTLTAIFGGSAAGAGITAISEAEAENEDEELAEAEIPDDEIAFINQDADPKPTEPAEPAGTRPLATTAAVSTPGVSRVMQTDGDSSQLGTGKILREWWISVEGSSVPELRNHSTFPAQPDGSDMLTRFEAPTDSGDDIGQRIHGYLNPPVSGDYQFWIAADDAGELWLSTDEGPANARWIAGAPSWTSQRQWDRHPEQQSGLISLEAGKRYYIMALHKEADNKDNLAVAWLVPGGERAVIEGQYLSPFGE